MIVKRQEPDFYLYFFQNFLSHTMRGAVPESGLVEALAGNATMRHYEKKNFIIEYGDSQRYLYFVYSGIYRCFTIKQNGHEITNNFSFIPGEAYIAGISFEEGDRAIDTVQALTEGDLILVPLSVLKRIRHDYPEVNNILVDALVMSFRKFYELMEIRSLKPMNRVKWLCEHHPILQEKIQQQYLASYLDIERGNYSRYLTALNKENSSIPGGDRKV